MRQKSFFLCFALLVIGSLMFFHSAAAGEKMKVGTFPIPLMVIDQNRGVFIDLVKEIAQRTGIEMEIIIAPPNRIIQDFVDGKIDMFFPGLDVSFPVGHKFIPSPELIYVKKDFAFTKKGNPLLKSISELEGKKIGITRGYPYVRALIDNKKIQIEVGDTDEINTKKLIAGRIDAFVVEEKSGLKAFENTNNMANMQYDVNAPLSSQNVYYAFQDNTMGKNFSAKVSQTLANMKQDGTFAKIMSSAK
jgi:polar amino acid transport system substrate-binding protein